MVRRRHGDAVSLYTYARTFRSRPTISTRYKRALKASTTRFWSEGTYASLVTTGIVVTTSGPPLFVLLPSTICGDGAGRTWNVSAKTQSLHRLSHSPFFRRTSIQSVYSHPRNWSNTSASVSGSRTGSSSLSLQSASRHSKKGDRARRRRKYTESGHTDLPTRRTILPANTLQKR
jgi:hypothetical protein